MGRRGWGGGFCAHPSPRGRDLHGSTLLANRTRSSLEQLWQALTFPGPRGAKCPVGGEWGRRPDQGTVAGSRELRLDQMKTEYSCL